MVKLKLRMIRVGVWFRVLPRIDESFTDLTIKVAHSKRSTTLASSIVSIEKKLETPFKSRFTHATRDVGLSLTCKLSLIAQNPGNKTPEAWSSDVNFARYLDVITLNG